VRIENSVFRFKRHAALNWLEALSSGFDQELRGNVYPLRFSIVDIDDGQMIVEATTVRYSSREPYADRFGVTELLNPRQKRFQARPFGIVQIVPTGIRCEFGGFAGDACPVTNLLAAAVDFVVTHPNAVNASELNEMAENVFYVEGKSLDDFLLGHLALLPVISNRIATVVDCRGIDYLDYVVNTLNAARAVKGISCEAYTLLREELGVRIEWSGTGCAVGTILNPGAILDACAFVLGNGVDAVGGVSVIEGVTKEMFSKHLHGQIPNPSGGVEAIITHLVSKIFRVPTAHAPLPYYQDMKAKETTNPRASAEFIFIPHYFCVLKGLAKAPRLVAISNLEDNPAYLITLNNIGAIVVPASCLGGIPALASEFSGIPLIAIRDNETVLRVTNNKMKMANVIEVSSYLEATGVILALRSGISLESLRRPLDRAKELKMPGLKPVSLEERRSPSTAIAPSR
jgi:hypothetical protein